MNKAARLRSPKEPEPAQSVLSVLLQVARTLEGRVEGDLARRDLSGAKANTLELLAEAKEPLPLSELAQQNACVRSNITQLVDRLEADGLVRRVNDPHDRRVRRAALTSSGRQAHQTASRLVGQQEKAVAAALTPAEAATLVRLLRKLIAD
jgi:DNA-binding MarR family transcriptional regulator